MDLQQMTFMNEPACEPSPVYRGGSRASRIAQQESVKHLVMSVICGPRCGVSLASLDPDGLWLKMFGDCFQARMDGSLLEYSGTLPRWGMMWAGELSAQPQLEPSIDESEWQLLPTPTASECHGGSWRKDGTLMVSNLKELLCLYCKRPLRTVFPHPEFVESMMGFPPGWTVLDASETPSCPSSSTPSSEP